MNIHSLFRKMQVAFISAYVSNAVDTYYRCNKRYGETSDSLTTYMAGGEL